MTDWIVKTIDKTRPLADYLGTFVIDENGRLAVVARGLKLVKESEREIVWEYSDAFFQPCLAMEGCFNEDNKLSIIGWTSEERRQINVKSRIRSSE